MMIRSIPAGVAGVILALASGTLCAQPALAVPDHRQSLYEGTNRAAFAGAAVRLEMGGKAKPAVARLQVGLRSVSIGRQSEVAPRFDHFPVLELGIGGRESGNIFVAGQSTSALEQKIGLQSDTIDTVWIVASVALVAVGVLVITSLDGLSHGGED